MQVEPVKVEFIMETNVKSFNDGVNYARDTGKKIDQELRRKLELDIAQAQLRLQEIRADLKKTKDADSRIQLQIDVNAAQRSLTELKRQMNNLSNTGDTSLSRLQAKFNGLGDSIKGALGGLGSALGFASVGVVVGGVLNSIKNLGANLQQVTVAFETMLGSAEKAKIFLKDLSDFASVTPFTIGDVRDNAKQLLAMGVAADNIIPTMKALGDVAAGQGIQMDRLALAYGQVITKGRLQGGEMKQFLEAGVPLTEELAKVLGVAGSEIAGLIEDGQISAIEVTKAFQAMSGEGGRFANLMEKQSKTFNGLVSNIQDNITKIGEYVGAKLIPTLTSIAEGLAQTTTDYGYAFGEVFAGFVLTITDTLMRGAQTITEFYNVIMGNTDAIGEQQVTFTELVYKAFKVLLIGLQATIKGIQALGGLVGTVLGVWFNHIQSYVTTAVNTAIGAINFVSKAINAVTGASIKPIELFKSLPQLSYFTELKAVSGDIAKDFLSIDTDLTLRKSLQTAKKLKEIDLSKIGSTQKTKDDAAGGAGSKEEKANKDRHDAELKAIDLQAQREVDAIKKSVDDEQTKADKIVKILEEADKKKKKMNDEYNKTAENYNKQQLDDAKELLKQEEELRKKKEQYTEKEKKLLADLADANKKNSQAIYDDVKKKLEETGEEIKKITDKITDLKKELTDLGSEKNSNIAQRVVEINKELQKNDLTIADRTKLLEELSLATANTTQEEINRQTAISQESKTQTIIREFGEKKAELEAKLKLEEDNLKAQLKIETDYKAQKLKLETDYTTLYKEEIDKRESAEMESIARIKSALMDLRSQAVQDSVITSKKAETLNEYMNASGSINQKNTNTRRLSVPGSTSSNQTTNNNTITQNNNINSQVDLDSVNRDLANKIIV